MNTKRVRFAETASVLAYEVEGSLKAASYGGRSTAKLPTIADAWPPARKGSLFRQGSLKPALRAPAAKQPQIQTPKRALFYLP